MKVILFVTGLSLEALVDTGANHSMIGEEAVLRIVAKTNTTRVFKIFGVAEAEGVLSTGPVELEVTLADIDLRLQEFIVLPAAITIPSPIILGMGFLKNSCVSIHVGNRSIRWRNASATIDLQDDVSDEVVNTSIRTMQCYAQI
jgi:predicted aspartyl protease